MIKRKLIRPDLLEISDGDKVIALITVEPEQTLFETLHDQGKHSKVSE